ncbi:MAG: excinuclease ABC subunit A, partial [Planctomycetaceae bacterium]|nr:excinuclease ABC subunit A [Planctomycetaceae bacterium]
RVGYLNQVGLGYLTLDRRTRSLSGGEFQRARLAGCLGSGLLGVNYILDEPTIGLHSRDTSRLIQILEELRDAGNTVTLVEHDGTVIRAADHVIDVGPGAGERGGEIVAKGTPAQIAACSESPTGRHLTRTSRNLKHQEPPSDGSQISLRNASIHNLKHVDVDIPLSSLTAVTGVSGSGKSSLILHTLVPAIRAALDRRTTDNRIECGKVSGAEHIDRVIQIDSSPLGRNGRSNPATASGAWDEVRRVFAATREARIRGYAPRRFSFNVAEGRCKKCAGQGTQRIEMHFLPDIHVPCEACRGARFNRRTLAVRYRGKNVAQVLGMPIDEAASFFENFPKLHRTLQTFGDVGLGYLTLGQSALALSGGEAQRIKLAAELCRSPGEQTLYVLDEPTTGLHASDIALLVTLLKRLVEKSNTVVVIEHQLDLIAECDWIVDLGPEGGQHGGTITATGTPAQIAASATHTGRALAAEFSFATPSSED